MSTPNLTANEFTAHLGLDPGEIMLVKTSRYKKEDLSNLASKHHWEEKKCFCEQNNKFQQIVFEYNP